MNNKILIAIIIGVCMVAAAGILAFGMMNAHDTIVINSTNGTNITNHTNMTNNTTADHINHDDTSSNEISSTNDIDTSREAYESAAARKDSDAISAMNDAKIANGESFDPSF